MKKASLILSLAVLAAILVACGGGGGQPAPAQQPAPQPAAGQPAAPAMAKGDPAKGKEYFVTCAGCHGLDGKGVPGLGKDFTASEFVKSKSDQELVEFLKVGRPASDPLNTTGVDMPPKGGNPALTDQQLLDIVAYIRSLQK
ncbi:MAG: cytochrome c [Caldilineales bacterium]|nr:cytochrome c [Caldilineales bacterium]MDW8319253.1 cytochrome c [Anaerolineae bacterium]